jgi:hypothetical protein
MANTNFWEHLLVVLGNNLKKIQDTWVFLGVPDESFGSTALVGKPSTLY